jgi:hypothetical protein
MKTKTWIIIGLVIMALFIYTNGGKKEANYGGVMGPNTQTTCESNKASKISAGKVVDPSGSSCFQMNKLFTECTDYWYWSTATTLAGTMGWVGANELANDEMNYYYFIWTDPGITLPNYLTAKSTIIYECQHGIKTVPQSDFVSGAKCVGQFDGTAFSTSMNTCPNRDCGERCASGQAGSYTALTCYNQIPANIGGSCINYQTGESGTCSSSGVCTTINCPTLKSTALSSVSAWALNPTTTNKQNALTAITAWVGVC